MTVANPRWTNHDNRDYEDLLSKLGTTVAWVSWRSVYFILLNV